MGVRSLAFIRAAENISEIGNTDDHKFWWNIPCASAPFHNWTALN